MNANATIYWFQVLNYFGRKGYFYNGFTLPFLVGCRIVLEPEKELLSIKELINQANTLPYAPITIMKCGNIGEYVFGVMDLETDSIRKRYQGLYTEFGNLINTDQSLLDCNNIEQVIAKLEDIYNDPIHKGNYSKNNGLWEAFTEEDIKHLQELL